MVPAIVWYERYVALVRDTENGDLPQPLIMANAADAILRVPASWTRREAHAKTRP